MTTNQTERVSDEELDQMILKLDRDGMTPKMLSLMRELREVRRAKAPTAPDEQSFWNWLREEMPTTYRWAQELEDTPENSALITKGKASALDMLSAWKGCSAAMQLSGNSEQLEPVSNRDELMPGIKPAPELDSVAKNAESLPSNSPATPDGWISVSERMPDRDYVLAADISGAYYPPHLPNTQVGIYADWFGDGKPSWDDGDGNDLHLKQVTHWMPLPAAPKEVGL